MFNRPHHFQAKNRNKQTSLFGVHCVHPIADSSLVWLMLWFYLRLMNTQVKPDKSDSITLLLSDFTSWKGPTECSTRNGMELKLLSFYYSLMLFDHCIFILIILLCKCVLNRRIVRNHLNEMEIMWFSKMTKITLCYYFYLTFFIQYCSIWKNAICLCVHMAGHMQPSAICTY